MASSTPRGNPLSPENVLPPGVDCESPDHLNNPASRSNRDGSLAARMWYFAYGSNLNVRAVAQWCRHHGRRLPSLRDGKPGVLPNYRLCFPIYSELWGGGIADIVYDPGKSVYGALFDVTDAELKILDEKVGRKLDANGREVGVYRRLDVVVHPLGRGEPVQATTYQGVLVEKNHIPPSQFYMDLIIQGAYACGLSMMWIAYLQSFSTQPTRRDHPPGYGDSAARL
ncbi:MAG: gamma-glutamylcyclotransferase [Phycisphaerae bacterium]|nr:gamma-glutamylcyclotransferase [Phycisphaerae bacterium]MDW8263311.1 gamma-glutamylcyclotransferase family protein [Phycisphaerales bacterium]